MHVSQNNIEALHSAIDFIEHNADGAEESESQEALLNGLKELLAKMEQSKHKRLVRYYVNKKNKQ